MALNSTRSIISRSLIALRIPHGTTTIGAAPKSLQQVTARHETSSTYDKAANAGKECVDAAKNAAEKGMDKSKDMGAKAKQNAEEGWDMVKDTSEKIKDAVTGKLERFKEIGKEEAERVKASMNKKDHDA